MDLATNLIGDGLKPHLMYRVLIICLTVFSAAAFLWPKTQSSLAGRDHGSHTHLDRNFNPFLETRETTGDDSSCSEDKPCSNGACWYGSAPRTIYMILSGESKLTRMPMIVVARLVIVDSVTLSSFYP